MAYNPNSLEGNASLLKFRAVVGVIGWIIAIVFLWSFIHGIGDAWTQLRVMMSLGKLVYKPEIAAQQLGQQIPVAAFVGFIVGIVRAQTSFLEANKILCMVEQEKHLRLIAASAYQWTQEQKKN